MAWALLWLAAMAVLHAQPETAAPLAFDVVSVKPHAMRPGTMMFRFSDGGPLHVTGNTFNPPASTLSELLIDAYDVKAYQISGLPAWAQSPNGDHFDVQAKSERVPTPDELRQMLQTLLADRFQVKLHKERKDLPVYALVLAKGGSKLRKLTAEEAAAANAPRERSSAAAVNSADRPAVINGTLIGLIRLISLGVDLPVIDHTGLPAGTYESANLNWGQFGRDKRGGAPDAEDGLSIFAALQRELGLKLEPRKEPLEMLVIDRAEKPTAN
jgi:uncharacterized protein (TIGR03435 family)